MQLCFSGYSIDYLFDFSIATDLKNSTRRVMYLDQASLALSREYLIKGVEDEDVNHYYNYMQRVTKVHYKLQIFKYYVIPQIKRQFRQITLQVFDSSKKKFFAK